MSTELSEHPAPSRVTTRASFPYLAPFAAFLVFLALDRFLPFSPPLTFLLRFVIILAILVFVSGSVIPLRVSHFLGSALVGMAVFAVWVGPDILWPEYRRLWLFSNVLVGAPTSSMPAGMKLNWIFLAFRILGSVVNVPVLEELFWRGWLMRWLIAKDFSKVPLGTYTAASFWTVALLFGSEHGSYWDVGLVAGAVYNWWVVRTKSLADCIFSHTVTNGCLAIYVLTRGQWQYWL